MSVRDLKRTATALDTTEQLAAFWLELAYAAGLIASDGEADERFAATPAAEEWLQLPDHERWAALAAGWLAATRAPGIVGTADAKGRALAALGPHLDRSPAPEVRRRALALLASLPPGTAVPAGAVLARLRWERPLRSGAPATGPMTDGGAPATPGPDPADDLRSRLAQWALTEAELLGVTGRGALATHGRTLLDTPPDSTAPTPAETTAAATRAAALLAPLLPEPVDHVLLQADLTAVAPGPLRRPLAEALGVLADIESKGGATVYRFTPGSVRRALDMRPLRRRAAGVPGRPLPHPGPPAARLPHRRRGPQTRAAAHRGGRRLCPL